MSDNHGDSERSLDYDELSRRRWMAMMSSLGAAGLAGCPGGGGGGDTPTDGTDDTPTETQDDDTPGDGGDGGDGGDETDTETATDEETDTPTGPPLRDTLRTRIQELPEELNFNGFANATAFGGVYAWIREIDQVRNNVGDRLWDGQTFNVDYRKGGTREVELNLLTTDLEFTDRSEDHTTLVYTFNSEDEFTFWDGTPITPEVYELHNKLGYHMGDNWNNDAIEHTWGIVEDDPNRLWYYWGGKPGVDAGAEGTSGGNPPVNMRNWINPQPGGGAPLHPTFTQEWVDRFEEASTEEEHNTVSEELANYNLGLEEIVSNGWGSGVYQIESMDDVSSQSITLQKRDDHPNSELVQVPNIELSIARGDRYRQLLGEGEIDFANGVIQEDAPPLDRNVLPDRMQQVDTWFANGTIMLYFNWQNEHIARQGVRRAIAAAVPWPNVRLNGWGEGLASEIEYDVGCSNTAAARWFDDDFLEQLYKYPREADTEQASQWLQEAGYERSGGTWTYEDGTPLQINFINNNDIDAWVGAAQTIREALQSFGFEVRLDNLGGNTYTDRLNNDAFGMALMNAGRDDVFAFYGAHGGGMAPFLYANGPSFWRCQPDEETDVENKPTTVTVPNEPGALDIEGDGESYNMCQNSRDLFASDATQEGVSEIVHQGARWYNYDLPHFHFAQTNVGYAANVRDFNWPESGQAVNALAGHGGGPNQLTLGLPQLAYDESFDSP